MNKIAVLVAWCYWYDKLPGSCGKSRSSFLLVLHFPRPSALVLGSQHYFSPVNFLMINAVSLGVLLFETSLELGRTGHREEQNRPHQKLLSVTVRERE